MTANHQVTKEVIFRELETTRGKFHTFLDSLSEGNFERQSLNSGWANGEILAHMTFGFIVINVLLPMARLWGRLPKGSSKWFAWLLNALTSPFNWFNALGARMQGKVFTYERIGPLYDRVYFSLLNKVDAIKDEEWERGMYYPVTHFNFHLTQISR